ncbi:uncharacterized protein BCR38DRAFT_336790 [Pseudomassariella vexata]|uniref:GDP/GTP exchange factor Sec2 N-terminal domain-containing protein n=1 Tax=Pseudomassariella vexata TaxID=1141098 RepID=A0A1Y2E9R6_9PEZI|nr:uncharacterized protein BCR38DRAFT_336790 [Pseudomassariella vexata]ORY67605.1 hypothetical protein BCR38DRAFT_336790 [Pseudomassariella vexata]
MGFSFIQVAAWTPHQSPSPKPQRSSYGHFRTFSSISQQSTKSLPKPPSITESSDMAISGELPALHLPPQPKRMPSSQSLVKDEEFSTNPDPRSRAASLVNSGGMATPLQHPDLDIEVATLSTKLVNALNHQTTLDDTLGSTRLELDSAREKIRELEELVAKQQETLSGDVWIKRESVEAEKARLLARITEEKRQRVEAEKEKRRIEQELENLTTALFEEANKMVISAKEDAHKEQDILQRKNDQLKAQLADTESLLKSQQEQLTELKVVMEQMTAERDDHSGTTPSSPGFSKFDSREDDSQVSDSASHSGITEPFSPTYPTSFTHLLQPVLRTDLASYDDFLTLVHTSKNASSRVSSGSYSGLNPLLGLTSAGSNASTTSLSMMGTPTSSLSPQTPNMPASTVSAGSTTSSAQLPPLKETKFYKRVLAEDVEPTLRLDIAPGLSWLARRSVINAMTEGTLVVEPVPTNSPFAAISKPQFYPCSLCGESRKDTSHLRNHRFRTSEADSAQRYPLCKYCLGRVRSTCDFLGFLRIVKDGHWRADDSDAERAAWEESVRLREQMFWGRIGGGVIPASQAPVHGSIMEKSPRPSQEEPIITDAPLETQAPEAPASQEPKVTLSITRNSTQSVEVSPLEPNKAGSTQPLEVKSQEVDVDTSTQSLEVKPQESDMDGTQKLSISIPGSFDAE